MSQPMKQFLQNQKKHQVVKMTLGRQGQKKKVLSLSLPITVGSSSECDVVVNASSVPSLSKVIYADKEGEAKVWDVRQAAEVPKTSLQDLGLTLHSRHRRKRQATITTAAVVLSVITYFALRKPEVAPVVVDSFQKPVDLTFGQVFPYFVDSTEQDRSYANGVQFDVAIKAVQLEKDLRLSFEGQGLDELAEFHITFNGQRIAELNSDANCVASPCAFSFLVPKAIAKAGKNRLAFVHTVPLSSYTLKSILVAPVSPVNAVEMATLQRRYAAGLRAYEERSISPLNLLKADNELRSLKDFLGSRTGVDELMAQTQALHGDVVKALQVMRDDLLFSARRDITLGKIGNAIASYRQLSQLYADPADPRALAFQEAIKELEKIKQ